MKLIDWFLFLKFVKLQQNFLVINKRVC